LIALSVLEKEFYPGFPIIRGAFKLRELISPQNGLREREGIIKHSTGISTMTTVLKYHTLLQRDLQDQEVTH